MLFQGKVFFQTSTAFARKSIDQILYETGHTLNLQVGHPYTAGLRAFGLGAVLG